MYVEHWMYCWTSNIMECSLTYGCHEQNFDFVEYKYFLLYNHNNIWITSFDVNFLPIPTSLMKN